MAHLANSSSRSSRNLLRDIAAKGRGVTVEAGEHDICVLTEDFAVAEPPAHYEIGGFCRCWTQGVDLEVELVSLPDAGRSLLYLKAGQAIYAFIPPGTYSLRYRFLDSPGRYNAAFFIINEGLGHRLGLYALKAWQLWRRSPRALFAAVAAVTSRGDAVVATRVVPPDPGVPPAARLLATPRARPEEPQAASLPPVSIIIPTRDRLDLLEPCIASLRRLEDVAYDIVIVDNGTVEPKALAYLVGLAAQPDVIVLRQDIPFNFSRLCNAGATVAKGDALLFLNDDVEAMDGTWLAHMLAWLSDPTVGAVGARLLYPSRDLQHAGIATNLVPGPGHPWRGASPEVWSSHPLLNTPGEVDAVTGACLLVRRADFRAVGGFDEEAFAITLNDVDLCLKLRRRGLKSLYAPAATLIHKEGQSRGEDHSPAERTRRRRELTAFFEGYPDFARESDFYPKTLRRDSDQALPF